MGDVSDDQDARTLREELRAAGARDFTFRIPDASDAAAGGMLHQILNPDIPPGPPYVHTVVPPEVIYKPETLRERVLSWWRAVRMGRS